MEGPDALDLGGIVLSLVLIVVGGPAAAVEGRAAIEFKCCSGIYSLVLGIVVAV